MFGCVILDQGGLPFPAYPLMIVAAALATNAGEPLAPILFAATLGALFADLLWFAGGRRFGAMLLKLMCRVSLSPDSCVGLTRRIYGRYGAPSLVVAKYVPGFAAVATTLAGESGTRLARFLLYDGVGAMLWAAGAIALGAIFHEAVEVMLDELEQLGHIAIALLLAGLAGFVAFKWWQRYRFKMRIRMSRITVDELNDLIASGEPTILDVRSAERRAQSGWIPGSVYFDDETAIELPKDRDIVVYCDCPNDASAAVMADKLKQRGLARVRPLAGGIDAWIERGHSIERDAPARASA
ncbi:MAG TPA: rhodanese-like domain-containing protein [Pseudomonadales bacterium]|nr:rhodanese-like domain-containing protein [Pseudomonadales bacterium]